MKINIPKKLDIVTLIYIALFILMIIRLLNICLLNAVTSDNYFLINTGKYIIENKEIPTMNIWTMHPDFKIVIQQWLCCVENYIAYNIAGNLGLVVITIIHTIILNILLIKFTSLYTDNKRIIVIALCLSNYFASYFISARPSLVTISILTYELIQLELWRRSSKDKKSNIKLLINLAIISLLHINYHSALWLMDILFILPYMVPAIWEINKHNIKESLINIDSKMLLASIITIIAFSLINPNGIKSITYLGKSTEMFNIDKGIIELQPWNLNHICSIVIIVIMMIYSIYIYKHKYKCDKVLIYLTVGTFILSVLYRRNTWMIIFSLIMLLTDLMKDKSHKEYRVSENKCVIAVSIFIVVMVMYTFMIINVGIKYNINEHDTVTSPVRAIEYLDEDCVIYNDFCNGAYLELNGYKTYIDARPELYIKSINGKADIYQEWVDLLNGKIDIPRFIDKYKFNTFIVENGTVLDCYLHYNNNYTEVLKGNGYTVYR